LNARGASATVRFTEAKRGPATVCMLSTRFRRPSKSAAVTPADMAVPSRSVASCRTDAAVPPPRPSSYTNWRAEEGSYDADPPTTSASARAALAPRMATHAALKFPAST